MRTSCADQWRSVLVVECIVFLQTFLEDVDIPCANVLPRHSYRSVKPAFVRRFLELSEVVSQAVLGSRKDEGRGSHHHIAYSHD